MAFQPAPPVSRRLLEGERHRMAPCAGHFAAHHPENLLTELNEWLERARQYQRMRCRDIARRWWRDSIRPGVTANDLGQPNSLRGLALSERMPDCRSPVESARAR
jgi:hypothetical protein